MRAAVLRDTPVGALTLVVDDVGLRAIAFGEDTDGYAVVAPDDDPVLAATVLQLGEYFAGRRLSFDLPLSLGDQGGFRRAVYDAMQAIDYGDVATYGQLAHAAGSPRAARAVGQACHDNPLPIVIPCHRVVASDGTLGGYGGGLDVKRHLLALERQGQVPEGGWESVRTA